MTEERTWLMPRGALRLSLAEMARDGVHGCEGVAMWLGRRAGTVVTVTHVVALRGPGITKQPDYLSISADLLDDVGDLALARGVFLVGQVHSHGPRHGVDLSLLDRRAGIKVPDFLSAVAPDYAQRPDISVLDFGMHVFEPGEWRRMGAIEIARRVALTDEAVELLTAGQS